MGMIRPELTLWDTERANVLAREFGEPRHTEKQPPYEQGEIACAGPRLKLHLGQDTLPVTGFRNAAALRQSNHHKRVGFAALLAWGRRGHFAWTLDVAQWLDGLAQRQERSKAEAGRCDMT